MGIFSLDDYLWIAALIGQILLLCALFWRGSYRSFPVFTTYIAWVTISDPLLMLVLAFQPHGNNSLYYRFYFPFEIIQYALECGVLLEIASEVVRPARRVVPKNTLLLLVGIMAAVASVAFVFAAHANAFTFGRSKIFAVILSIDTTMAILRLLTFLLIAGFSQMLGVTWKHHVFQLTSGLAFYAALTLALEIAGNHLSSGGGYRHDYYTYQHLRVAGYLCTLYFWCYAFIKKEAPRKEFSPQMASFLLSISGNTKRHRTALARSRHE
jgi:hypothetical protein